MSDPVRAFRGERPRRRKKQTGGARAVGRGAPRSLFLAPPASLAPNAESVCLVVPPYEAMSLVVPPYEPRKEPFLASPFRGGTPVLRTRFQMRRWDGGVGSIARAIPLFWQADRRVQILC